MSRERPSPVDTQQHHRREHVADQSRLRIASAQQDIEMVILKARQRMDSVEKKVELTTDNGRVVVYGADAQRVLGEAASQLEERRAA
jgi:hypothetical protein